MIQNALLSVSDKTNIEVLAQNLIEKNVVIYSTGGTLRYLLENNISAKSISELTKFPEIMDGRVKTLHPKIHGGLLGIRNNSKHQEEAKENGIVWIDLVVANLYPFEKTISNRDVTLENAIENIDIGGPSMLRSAAKNYEWVTVVSDPKDYDLIIEEMEKNENQTTSELRKKLASKVFAMTSAYDQHITSFLETFGTSNEQSEDIPSEIQISLSKNLSMRYGENPHQKAGLYNVKLNGLDNYSCDSSFDTFFEKLHGKDLSYNNILDLYSAVELIEEFDSSIPTAAIIKHTNPCGVASSETLLNAYRSAFKTDTNSPFGGIVALNKSLDIETAKAINEIFTEIIIAPGYDKDVITFLQKKANRRIIKIKKPLPKKILDLRVLGLGALVQEKDSMNFNKEKLCVVSQKKPSTKEMEDLIFSWIVCKHVKSNAIVYAKEKRTLGIGGGQMSRIDSTRIAKDKASGFNLELAGSVVASDAFFPFADSLLLAADVGVTAVIQPGGSIRDKEIIDAANEKNIAVVFTGIRHFKH